MIKSMFSIENTDQFDLLRQFMFHDLLFLTAGMMSIAV